MAASSTTLSKGDNLPPRGRAKKTLILEAIKEQALIGMSQDSSQEQCEKAFFGHIANRALNPEDQNSGMLIKVLTDKGWASVKPSSECVQFDFDENATPAVKASQILKAAADGVIPPDIANSFINSVAAMLKIDEVTELQKRLESIEQSLGVNRG